MDVADLFFHLKIPTILVYAPGSRIMIFKRKYVLGDVLILNEREPLNFTDQTQGYNIIF
jgi:hypothetical protein